MKKKKLLWLILPTILLFISIFFADNIYKSMNFGLDLKGGFEVLYEVSPLNDDELTSDMVYSTYKTLVKRIDVLGVSEPEITIEGKNRIRIRLAGVTDSNSAKQILQSTASITFRDASDNLLMTSEVLGGSVKLTTDNYGRPAVSLPIKDKDKFYKVTNEIKDKKETLIFYESPHRLLDTLSFLKNSLGNRSIAVCRELTKLHEDIFRGTLEDAYNNFLENKPRGEFVLVLAGKSESEIKAELEEEFSALTVKEHLKDLINKGMDKKEAIKTVAKMRNIPKKEVYKSAIDL